MMLSSEFDEELIRETNLNRLLKELASAIGYGVIEIVVENGTMKDLRLNRSIRLVDDQKKRHEAKDNHHSNPVPMVSGPCGAFK